MAIISFVLVCILTAVSLYILKVRGHTPAWLCRAAARIRGRRQATALIGISVTAVLMLAVFACLGILPLIADDSEMDIGGPGADRAQLSSPSLHQVFLSVDKVPNKDFLNIAHELTDLISSYTSDTAEARFSEASRFLSNELQGSFAETMMQAELADIKQTNRAQFFLVDKNLVQFERFGEDEVVVRVPGVRIRFAENNKLSQERWTSVLSMKSISSSAKHPRGIVVSRLRAMQGVHVRDSVYDTAEKAFVGESFEPQLSAYKELAVQGDAGLRYYIARMYDSGLISPYGERGLAQDESKATMWLEMAAKKNHVAALKKLGRYSAKTAVVRMDPQDKLKEERQRILQAKKDAEVGHQIEAILEDRVARLKAEMDKRISSELQ